jgi:para-nitrobenzyl esterase
MIAERLIQITGLMASVCSLACAAPSLAADAGDHPVVVTPVGAVRGLTIGAMDSFRGIPYAAPPLAALRWQPPAAAIPWQGTLNATAFGPHCPQNGGSDNSASTDENCLFLNVYAPAGGESGARKPVMVFFHGGGFSSGESDDYDPAKWVAHDRVVVTLNYRLGWLGFLETTGLQGEPHDQVNYGILDQRAALKWVQANIAAFGGDPRNVTILGQSAGGASVITHLVSPGSRGLYQGGLIESGSYAFITVLSLDQALANGNAFATYEHCATTDTACLRALSVKKILAAPTPIGVTSIAGGLTVDGTILPETPLNAAINGDFARVPIVQGTNHDEFRLFTAELFDLDLGPLTAAEYPVFVQLTLTEVGMGADTKKVLAKYPLSKYASPDLAISAMATDAAFASTAMIADNLLAIHGPTYAYEFADENCPDNFLPPVSFPPDTAHEFELPYLGDSFTRTFLPFTPGQRKLSASMIDYWTRFSGTGTPNWWNTPLWLPFVPIIDDVNEFVTPNPNMGTGFTDNHKVLFWAELAGMSGLFTPGAHFVPPAGFQPRLLTLDAFAKVAARRATWSKGL